MDVVPEVELNPNLHHVHTQLGILKLDERVSWRETLPHLQRAAEIEPLDVEAALTLILFMQNVPQRWDEADEMLARLDQSHPDRADVKQRQGEWQLWVKGRPSEAIPLFEQALIIGDRKPIVAALVVLDIKLWNGFAAEEGLDPADPNEPAAEQALRKRINARCSAFADFAQVRRIGASLEPWTAEEGLLSVTLKVKRDAVAAKFEKRIQDLFAGHE